MRDDDVLRSMLRGVGWLTSANGLVIVLSIVQGVLTARLLGPTGYGILASGLAFVGLVTKLLSFRMNEFVVKWVIQLRGTSRLQACSAFRLGIAGEAAALFLAFVLVETLSGWAAVTFAKDPDFAGTLRLLGFLALIQLGRESALGILNVDHAFRAMSLVYVAGQVVSLAGVMFVFLGGGGINGVVVAVLAGEAARSIAVWTLGARAARAILGHGWLLAPYVRFGGLGREMLRFVLLTNIGASVGTVGKEGDILVVGLLCSPTSVAYYKLAQSISQMAMLPVMPLATVTYPDYVAAVAQGSWAQLRQRMRQGSKVAAAWLLPISILLAAAAPTAISILYGSDFVPAAPALAILLVGLSVDGILFWTRGVLLALDRPGFLTQLNLGQVLVKLALAFAFVPIGGYLAMAGVQTLVLSGANGLAVRKTLGNLRRREAA
jgi:O-antigen/teichoic acid export membrane protein